MSLASVPNFQLLDQTGSRLTLRSTEGHLAYIFVLEEDILRVVVLTSGKFNFPRTWAIAPGCEVSHLRGETAWIWMVLRCRHSKFERSRECCRLRRLLSA